MDAKWKSQKQYVNSNKDNPSAWLGLVSILPEVNTTAKFDFASATFHKAFESLPLEVNRYNEDYCELWMRWSDILRKNNPVQAREAYKFMESQSIAESSSLFYLYWSQLEKDLGSKEEAHSIISKGLSLGAKPTSLLLKAQQELQQNKDIDLRFLSYRSTKDDSVYRTPLSNISNLQELTPNKQDHLKQSTQVQLPMANQPLAVSKTPPPVFELHKSTTPVNSSIPALQTPSTSASSTTITTPLSLPSTRVIINGVEYAILPPEIGSGGSSKVYKVLSPSYKVLALKIVTFKESHDYNMYMQEVGILHKFRGNPYIIQMLDYEISREDSQIRVVLELGEMDFNRLIAMHCHPNFTKLPHWKRFSDLQMRHYWKEMISAVNEIHKGGVVHTDLKPANFLVIGGGLKLIDFGIAVELEGVTSVGRNDQVGTLNFISPEACHSMFNPTKRIKVGCPADVWSLGIILYFMTYGYGPFHSLHSLAKVVSISDPNYTIDYKPCDDQNLLNVIQLCLVREPKARPTIDQLLTHPFLCQYLQK